MSGLETLAPVTIASAFAVGMVLALLGSIKLPLAKRLQLNEARVGGLLSALSLALIPMMLGALALGLAIGLAIRYASSSEEKEVGAKNPLKDVNWSAISVPFLWPFFKTVKRKYEHSTDAVRDRLDRVRDIDVDRYVKPLRKRWAAWTD